MIPHPFPNSRTHAFRVPVKMVGLPPKDNQAAVLIPFCCPLRICQRHNIVLTAMKDQNRAMVTVHSILRMNGLSYPKVVSIQLQPFDYRKNVRNPLRVKRPSQQISVPGSLRNHESRRPEYQAPDPVRLHTSRKGSSQSPLGMA